MDIFDFENDHEEKPQHASELWLVTYSDLLSLLLGCFVMMMAMSSVNKGKFDEVAGELKESLDQKPQNPSKVVPKLSEVREKVEDVLKAEDVVKDATVKVDAEGMSIVLNEAIVFPSGGAQILAENANVIRGIGAQLAKLPTKKITVEGHTDDLPIHSANFQSNWELSAARALAVLQILQESGIPGSKLNFQGFGEFSPEVPNHDEESRRKNRRVVIRIN